MAELVTEPPYSRWQRTWYFWQRHLIFVAIFVPAVWYLHQADPGLMLAILSKAAKIVMGYFISLISMKFFWPKTSAQSEMLKGNLAVAVVVAAFVIAAAL